MYIKHTPALHFTEATIFVCKQCSFECDMGKYNTRWAFKRTHYSLDMRCIFQCCLKINKICIFSLNQVTQGITGIRFSSNYTKREIWTDTDIRLIVKTTAYMCDMSWYRYTSHVSQWRLFQRTWCTLISFGLIASAVPWFLGLTVVPMQLPYQCTQCQCSVNTVQALMLAVLALKQLAI